MKTKAAWKMAVDICMLLALLFLMGYEPWGEAAHEWAGAGILVLFIAHNVLNRKWYASLFKGRYTPMRVFQACINLLTLAAMAAQMYSGIVMSRHVFDFLPIDGGMSMARRLHILGAYWGYLLISLHFGIHWNMVLERIRKRRRDLEKQKGEAASDRHFPIPFLLGLAVAAYGLWVFIKRDFLTYMFLQSEFVFLDYEEPALLFYADYLALMGLCVFAAHYVSKALKKAGAGKSRRREQ